jgi:hypothetical protein
MENSMKKTILCFALFLIYQNSFSEDVIYKCLDKHGNISYVTDEKNYLSCEKTNLAVIDKLNIFNPNIHPNMDTNPHGVSTEKNTVIPNISPNEQAHLDIKRNDLLNQELEKEKMDLAKVQQMIKESAQNPKQLQSLLELEKTHEFNISQIQHDLGIQKKSSLPISQPLAHINVAQPIQNNVVNIPPKKLLHYHLKEKPYSIEKSLISSNNVSNPIQNTQSDVKNIHISPSNFLLGH